MSFKEKLKSLFVKAIDELPEDGLPPDPQLRTFSEGELAAKVKAAEEAAAKKAKEEAAAEFAESQRQERFKQRKAEVAAWAADMVKAGKLTPALVKFGIPELLISFAEREDLIEFGEAKEKTTYYERFKGLFEKELPKLINFAEFATRDKLTPEADEKEALIQSYMESHKDTNYRSAAIAVAGKHPALFR